MYPSVSMYMIKVPKDLGVIESYVKKVIEVGLE